MAKNCEGLKMGSQIPVRESGNRKFCVQGIIQEILAIFGILRKALNNWGFGAFMKILFWYENSVDDLRIWFNWLVLIYELQQ